MPTTFRSPTKRNNNDATQKNNNRSRSSSRSGGRSRTRKRKLCEILKESDDDELESELEDCNMEDAIAIEKKLRKIARTNALSDDEMRKLLQKFVKNEHILAFVTLKAEDELAREQREAEQRAVIITDTPSVPKLTRAKAKELNRTPAIALPSLNDSTEIASLIVDELHSDEDDEEYKFQEDDFISDDDPNTTISDMESNPRTPGTPLTQTEYEDSPVKFSADGCFKVPFDKQANLRIATRTRSKFCLQQTTIEDLQSEFVPPDVEHLDVQEAAELAANDEDWMQFLNDFSKPLNNTFMGDDDDPVNDPEYIAAEKITVDAEELRDVNISKKELTELVAELFEGLLNEGISLESFELETPQKFIQNNTGSDKQPTPVTPATPALTIQERDVVTRQIDFEAQQQSELMTNTPTLNRCVSDATISSTNLLQNEYSFQPNVMSTPSTNLNPEPTTMIPIANVPNHHVVSQMITLPEAAVRTDPELIAVRVQGQPNCFQLAKVVLATDSVEQSQVENATDTRYTTPYDTNYTWKYISIKKHVYSEYMQKFENLRNTQTLRPVDNLPNAAVGFTQHQHDILQQQLRIHTQLLTQNFLQTYSHPDLWEWADKPCQMLLDLKERAEHDASFNAWNLNAAVDLVTEWKEKCAEDNQENREMMEFLNHEVERTNKNTRQIARFPPIVMEQMLNSTVFMYPEFLPRVPFTLRNKDKKYEVFAPAESHLLAMGLEKHMKHGRNVKNKPISLRRACERISKDTIFGKTPRRIWDRIKILRNADYYNPVKYFFEHGVPPPIECKIYTFPNSTVLPPKDRVTELPLAWQKYLIEKSQVDAPESNTAPESITTANICASNEARTSYLKFVREAVGEDIYLPDSFMVAAEPELYATSAPPTSVNITSTNEVSQIQQSKKQNKSNKRGKRIKQQTLTINVNYVFGADAATSLLNNSNSSNTAAPIILDSSYIAANETVLTNESISTIFPPLPASSTAQDSSVSITDTEQPPVVAYNYDIARNTWQPLVAALPTATSPSPADRTQTKLTDYYTLQQVGQSSFWEDLESENNSIAAKKKRCIIKLKKLHKPRTSFNISKRLRSVSLKHRHAQNLRRRYAVLLTSYRLYLQKQVQRFKRKPLIQYFYRQFKALELYSDLLTSLKMSCKNLAGTSNGVGVIASGSPLGLGKRSRNLGMQQQLDDEASGGRIKKSNRQEENFRNMLLPDSAEDANRKDAIYAFNFYEKVEEVLKSSNRPEDCKRFNYILKSFDPKRDKVSELYYKLERLFLPDFPELAQVFLTFLLPSEAAEIGKFFEHFMAENIKTFINKLNIYFHKQPAQMRKVFNCLSELADEENVTIKTVESRILPLLRGNKFLEDWFMQLFPEVPPPERLLSTPEHVNLKETQNNQTGEFFETVMNLLDSPTQDQTQQQQQQTPQCQLRYINGRIFYGSKITLPAKLSFMAQKYVEQSEPVKNKQKVDTAIDINDGCIHAVREHGEQRIIAATMAAAVAAASVTTIDCSSSEDNEKSEEEDASKALVIDSTGDDESGCSSIFEACDEATLRAHAVRLNPNYYSNACYSATTSTSHTGHNTQQHTHHANAKRVSLSFADDIKLSPRKQSSVGALSSSGGYNTHLTHSPNVSMATSSLSQAQREKRKSPIKKTGSMHSSNSANTSNNTKSLPTNKHRAFNVQPMVVIHEQNSAIACAKKLKSLIEYGSESDVDTKAGIAIVARAKHTKTPVVAENSPALDNTRATSPIVKIEENSDDLEFLPEHVNVSTSLAHCSFPTVKMDDDSTQEEAAMLPPATTACKASAEDQNVVSSSNIDSDEDCKLDIVATLCTASAEEAASCSSTSETFDLTKSPQEQINRTAKPPPAWTRNEDKIILIEMKLGSRNRDDLFQRIKAKLPERSILEITGRHQFLIEFLSKLQGN